VKRRPRRRSDGGFTVVGLLVLLPFLVSIVAVMSGAMMLISADAELKHECRTTLIDAQDEIARDLEALMKLNGEARALRKARAAAERMVRLAVAPPAAVAARAALALVIARQTALAARQTALVFRAKSKSQTTPLKTKLKLHRSLREKARLIETREAILATRLKTASFDVVRTPADSLTPDYNPAPGFSIAQEMSVDAEWSVTTLLPAWLRQWLGREDLKMKTTCRATIEKKGNGWKSLLKADKS
jgi:hypothetical protein